MWNRRDNTEKRDCETQVFLKGALDIFCSTSRSVHKYSLILDRNFFEESERDKNIVCTYKATVVDGTVGIRDNEWWLQRTVGPVRVLKHRQFSGHDNPVFTKHRVKIMKAMRHTAKRSAQDVWSAMVNAASSLNAIVSRDTNCWLGLPLNCRTLKRHTELHFKFHISLPQVRISYLLSVNHFHQLTGRNNYFDRTIGIYTDVWRCFFSKGFHTYKITMEG